MGWEADTTNEISHFLREASTSSNQLIHVVEYTLHEANVPSIDGDELDPFPC